EISTVAEIPGWYVWVTAQDSIIDPIYVGRSFRGKTSNLKSRLHEEFFDEYVAFWATMAEPKQVEDKLCRKNLLIGYKEYRKSIQRSIRKRDTTDIYWLGCPSVSMSENKLVERFLIYHLQPPANVHGKKKAVAGDEKCYSVLEGFQTRYSLKLQV